MNDKETKDVKPYDSRDELLLAEAAAMSQLQIIRDLYEEALVSVPYDDQTKDHFYDVLNKYAKKVNEEWDAHDERSKLDIVPESGEKGKGKAIAEGVEARLNAVKAKEAQEYLSALDIRDRIHAQHANGIDRHREAYHAACKVIDKYESKQAKEVK